MAEQARKVGGRIAELRNGRQWKGKHLVARMAELGDQSLNTNQLSRYENGGAMPGETRLSRFASALETTVCDLYAGPMAERKQPKKGDLNQFNGAPEIADVAEIVALNAERILEVTAGVERLERQVERLSRRLLPPEDTEELPEDPRRPPLSG